MDGIAAFKAVAPHLTNPLVLVGFALLLVFGVHRALLKAGIIPPLSRQTGGKVVQQFLRYGFVIALVVIGLGFALAFYQSRLEHDPQVQKGRAETTRVEGLVAMAKGFCQQPVDKLGLSEAARQDMVRACAEAIHALAQTEAPEPQIEAALAQLAQGKDQAAKALFEQVLERKAAEGSQANREAAEAARHLGALAFKDDTQGALEAYRKAVKLDPDNWDGWNQLGHLLVRTGELGEAQAAYGRVKTLGEANGDQEAVAAASGNLGIVYQMRGDLAQAEAMLKKALDLDQALGRKEGLANDYGNLGNVYEARGDLAQAEAMHKQALELDQALGSKGGMANAYGNLGNVYQVYDYLAQRRIHRASPLPFLESLPSTAYCD
jgi:tetratricopeptide (TPR) repeat protein